MSSREIMDFPLLLSILFCSKKVFKPKMANKIQIIGNLHIPKQLKKSGPSADLKGSGES